MLGLGASLWVNTAAFVGPPVLSSPLGVGTAATTADVSVTTTGADGTAYWFISTSATPPTLVDLKAGTGSTAFGSLAITGAGNKLVGATGLTTSVTYYVHWAHTNAFGKEAVIVTSASWTQP